MGACMRNAPARHDGWKASRAFGTPCRAVVLIAAAAVALAACSSAEGSAAAKSPVITVQPGAGGKAVPVDRKVTIRAVGGTISAVQVSSEGPGKLLGSLSSDRHTWTSTEKLAPGARYTVSVRAAGAGGKAATKSSTFTTKEPSKTFVGEYLPDKGTTVGVGMPVSIVFNKPIRDKAAVERKLKVTASPAVDGAWSWLTDRNGKDRIDYRPKEFWKPGTKVTLRMSLDGVDAGGGVYGTQNRVVNSQIGDAVVSTVDVVKKTMTVTKNGKVLRTLPVSTGKPGFETWNGTMVVLSKVPTIRMDSTTVGIFGPEAYDLGEVKWDVQLTPSGTYIHAAPWNEGKFGKVNSSHGCVGLSTANAKWVFNQVHLGDPVTVINSKDTVATNNGYGDWNVDWATWQAGSALKK